VRHQHYEPYPPENENISASPSLKNKVQRNPSGSDLSKTVTTAAISTAEDQLLADTQSALFRVR
jgi:hypothetical protein